jgi:hypothetical protein
VTQESRENAKFRQKLEVAKHNSLKEFFCLRFLVPDFFDNDPFREFIPKSTVQCISSGFRKDGEHDKRSLFLFFLLSMIQTVFK